ncbi:NAD(P) transhydrogenase subunit alpha [Saccharophagus degradans]|uniref:proton-translocating NAD(P)(+) transhydrogenase n=1 Tax=Saccharophagus degradans (strain 2-40 / ATCC 43961 / DSM 17024) TaxID=203122 RepID=Q21L93_SACD2|nr:NAD(P) transhydrogenase subunit alpha [Saccharophagus degradans]ABD80536.1 alanine dehydrogenase/PNT-like protein [Saccharophagus degradans 2-40]WGO97270.1 NAD(P) transhydrogenase subunit alpha [Saccharophagus degradans]
MKLVIGVVRESALGESRVAIAPDVVQKLNKLGVQVVMQQGAGASAFLPDEKYKQDNVTLVESAADVYAKANLFIRVQTPSLDEIAQMPEGSYLLGALTPHKHLAEIKALADKKITCWATEYIPRISRAQSMDTLSSQAAVAGYVGVVKAAGLSAKFFPMLTTAAGTVRPAKVLVLGAGVAGLQAIATAKRLGAVVEAYDIRPETKEQCESLGAKFIDTGVNAAGEGGYARELTAEEVVKQTEIVDQHIAKADAVITTAAIPGRPSPKLISASAVAKMQPGAVIIDLASEGGGNCELTKPGEIYQHEGVVICGELNVPAQLAVHASEMFSKNLFNFISPWLKDAQLVVDWEDEIISQSCLVKEGEVVNSRIQTLLGGGA